MRIATWNLARAPISGIRTSRLLDHIRNAQADVWVLTETRLALYPGADYELLAHSAAAPDREADECWTAIWIRQGIYGEAVPSLDPERTACVRLRAPSGQTLYVYGSVLPWLTDTRRSPLTGASAFAAALAEQAADWQLIRSSEPFAVLCVAGDLNQDLLTHGHYYGSADGRQTLSDALRQAGLTCLTAGEADPVARIGAGRASIDHLCLSRLRADESIELSVWPSHDELGPRLTDHHGVAARVPSLSRGADDAEGDGPPESSSQQVEAEDVAAPLGPLHRAVVDLRMPLAMIMTAAEFLDDFDDPQQVRKYAAAIRKAAARMDRLLLELLELAHHEQTPAAEGDSLLTPRDGLAGEQVIDDVPGDR